MGNFHNFASFCHGIFHKLVPKKGVPKKRSRKEASTSQRRPTWSKVAQGCLRSSPHDAVLHPEAHAGAAASCLVVLLESPVHIVRILLVDVLKDMVLVLAKGEDVLSVIFRFRVPSW